MTVQESEIFMRKVKTMTLGSLGTNCHVVYTGENTVIAADIGGDSRKFLDFLKNENLTLTKILLTHGHYDHIGGVLEVQKATGAQVFIHEEDVPMLSDTEKNLALWIEPYADFEPVTEFSAVKDGDVIEDGDASFTVLHTPGHTRGSVCYLCEDIILSGDTLFCLSRGRTDFPGGSDAQMLASFKRLKELQGDYRVFPGHNESTTLEFERKNNPVMRGIK